MRCHIVPLSMMFYSYFIVDFAYIASILEPQPSGIFRSGVQVAWQKMAFSPSWWILGSDAFGSPTQLVVRASLARVIRVSFMDVSAEATSQSQCVWCAAEWERTFFFRDPPLPK